MNRLLTVAVAAATLLALSCGGDEGPAAEETTATTSATTSTTAAPSTTTTTATAVPTTTTTTTTTVSPTTTSVVLTPAQTAFLDALGKARSSESSGRAELAVSLTGLDGTVEGAEVAFVMSMEFDPRSGDFAWSMDLSSLADLADADDPEMQGFADLFGTDLDDFLSEIEVRQVGDTAYMKFPFLTTLFGIETDWMSFPAEDAGIAEGFTPVSPAGPQDFLNSFGDSVPRVTEVGIESIRGAETVHYVVEYDGAELAELGGSDTGGLFGDLGGLSSLPVDFWITDDGTVHRVSLEVDGGALDLPVGDGFSMMSMVFDFFDHGATIEITPPPADQVTDASELMGVFDI